MNENKARVDWQGILAFVLLVLILTWPAEIMAILKGVRFDSTSVTVDQTAGFLLIAVNIIPALAAWIVRATATKEGFATAGLQFGPWQYYVLCWLAVPWIYALVYGLSLALGFGHLNPAFPSYSPNQISWGLAASLSIFILPGLIPAFGLQFGWTGFVLPKLLPLGLWPATILYGLMWGAWQLPLAAAGYIYSGRPIGFVLIVLFTCVLALIEGALRIRSGSLFLSTFFEAAFSTQARGVVPILIIVTQPLLGGVAGVTGIVVLGAIGAWLLATTPQAAVDAVLAPAPVTRKPSRTKRKW